MLRIVAAMLLAIGLTGCDRHATAPLPTLVSPQVSPQAAASACEQRPVVADVAAGKTPVRVLVFGDFGSSGRRDRQPEVAAAMRRYFATAPPPDFALLLGDNFYPDGVESVADPDWRLQFADMYRSILPEQALRPLTFFPVLGNHDARGDAGAQIAYSAQPQGPARWRMPAHNYTISTGPAAFFALNTAGRGTDAPVVAAADRAWLACELQRATQPWKIVFAHHPVATGGSHDEDAPLAATQLLGALLGRADLYLAGHDHDLQILDTAANGQTLTTVIAGGGGRSRSFRTTRVVREVPSPGGSAVRTRFCSSSFGFAVLEITPATLTITMVPVTTGHDGEPVPAPVHTCALQKGEAPQCAGEPAACVSYPLGVSRTARAAP